MSTRNGASCTSRHLRRGARAMGMAALVAGVWSCASKAPAVQTSAPVVAAPAPPVAVARDSTTTPAPMPTLAVIPVQVTYVLTALRPSLDSLFPARDSLSAPQCQSVAGLVCHQYVYRRESLQLRATASRLDITTNLSYRAQVGMLGRAGLAGCGYAPEAMRRAALHMTTSLYWRRDWRIGAAATKFDATLTDPCKVTLFGVNATRTLQGLIDKQLSTFASEADSTIPIVADLRPLADSLWRSFLEPTPLDTLNSLWLLLEPEAVRVTPFVGTGQSITTTMVLYARPRVISGSKPSVRARALPVLALGDAPRMFRVPVQVELPFDDVARRTTALLKADPPSGGVRVDSVQVRARGDTALVDLQVSGTMRGRLSMVSRLRWDATARELRLDDLDWTLESRGMLSKMTATLAAPFIGRAIRRATLGGRVPLGAQLDSVRTELLVKLNGPVGPGVVMASSVSTVQILGVSSSATAFVVRAQLDGTSGVWFR